LNLKIILIEFSQSERLDGNIDLELRYKIKMKLLYTHD